MAATMFEAFIRRNNNRMVVILVYSVLEWILISLLLLESILSYLSYRFAAYFRLKTPCLFCSRLEHHFRKDGGRSSYRDLLCEDHAAQVSLLGYCSVHRKLAEAASMCEECSSSRPSPVGSDVQHPAMAVLLLMKSEREGKDLDCSCCHVPLESGFYSMELLRKPSCDDALMGDSIKGKGEVEGGQICDHGVLGREEIALERASPPPPPSNSGIDGVDTSLGEILDRHQVCESRIVPVELIDSSTFLDSTYNFHSAEVKTDEVIRMDLFLDLITASGDDDAPTAKIVNRTATPVMLAQKSDRDSCKQLIGVDEEHQALPEDSSSAMKSVVAVVERQQEEIRDSEDGDSTESEANYEVTIGSEICATDQIDHAQLPQLTTLVDVSTENCGETVRKDDSEHTHEASAETVTCDQENVVDQENHVPISPSASETIRIIDHEDTCEISASSEICHKEQIGDDLPLQGKISQTSGDTGKSSGTHSESEIIKEVFDGNSRTDCDDHCEVPIRNEMCIEDRIDQSQLLDPLNRAVTELDEIHVSLTEPLNAVDHRVYHQLSTSPKRNETDEERMPETPNTLDGMYNLHKRFLLDRKESSTESIDGSIASELEMSEVSSVDQLKAALKAERRTLNVLYAELEEERSASAIAANQTMAMITRLQQEKAAMQMEALQYQRMMEEQSEYDQEALHLLNDLVTKKEQEKQELEKELEIYRKKVCLYKAKGMKTKSSSSNGRSCTSPALSSAEDSDDLSIGLNEGEEQLYDLSESNNKIPIDGILTSGVHHKLSKNILNESLADLEEERISILQELKVLEEKLFSMDGGEDSCVEELPENYNLLEENGRGHDVNNELQSNKANGNHADRRNICSNGKRLLPLFNFILSENEDSLKDSELADISRDSVSKLTPEKLSHEMAEKMDHIYQRLHALEVDRRFLIHGIESMTNGGKGIDVLLEILQHLRELRNLDIYQSHTSTDHRSFSL